MPRERKLGEPVTLFAAIEREQYDFLRTIAFREHRSLADVVREAIDTFIQKQPKKRAEVRLATRPEKREAVRA